MKPARSKTVATWAALLGGSLGAHRFYLNGAGDWLGWLHPLPTLAGLYGVLRMRAFGVDDRLAWVLIPLLGVMLSMTMLRAILYGLTPDEAWDRRYRPSGPPQSSGWGAVIGVIVSLMVGAAVLLGTIAFTGQHVFEVMLEDQASTSSPSQ